MRVAIKRTYAVDYEIMLKRIKTYKDEDFTMMVYQFRVGEIWEMDFWELCVNFESQMFAERLICEVIYGN